MTHFDTMVAVLTGQNITNAIPAIDAGIKNIIFIETPYAKQKHWLDGIKKVLTDREINVLPCVELSREDESRIDKIIEILNSRIPNQPVIWNLGGGQKAQQLAIWEFFRSEQRQGDVAIYINQSTKKQEWWYFENKQ